ncbi:glycosyltransferase [Neobacillus sp. WH10]|uniref:glycosyltransferase n=1 Tax=Neobacillus sp. WH10 TaxID=3047873 RepID=UPI0024C1A30C|nr:glycosyltransferase [Neobacillus sp. WH10]WHY77377.1 glycosyltransferase [Neobacillus sp. WH10]
MNILIIPSWYPSKSNPLSGSFFREQAISLHKAGHKVIVVNVSFQDRRGYFDVDNFKLKKFYDEGVIVYSYTIPAFGLGRAKRLMISNFYKRLNRVYRKIVEDGEQVDIIHAHSYMPAGYCACKIGEMNNIPVVITEHSSKIINKDLSPIEVNYLKKCLEMAECFICVGDGLKQSVIELTGTNKKIEVVPNMVSSLFQYKEKNRHLDDFIFCSVGNLIGRKRFGLTINAFTKSFKGNGNIKLQIIGGGSLYNELKEQIDNLGMNEQIFLLGEMDREKVKHQLQACDTFVLASANETFGVVYIEALACGKPVIGTRNGGAEWIINEDNGVLVDVDNEVQLADAMLKMVNNYNDYHKNEISRATISQYGEKPVTSRLNLIYERCIKE